MSGLHELGLLVHFAGDTARAEQLFRESVAVGDRIAGPSTAKITSLLHKAELVTGSITRRRGPSRCCARRWPWRGRSIQAITRTSPCLGTLAENLGRLRKLPEAESVAREGAAMGCGCTVPGTRRRSSPASFWPACYHRRKARGSGAHPEGLAGRRTLVPR